MGESGAHDHRPLLAIDDLVVTFPAGGGRRAVAVDGVSLRVFPGQTVAIVGESGSGKSVLAMCVPGLVASPPARVESGRIVFRASDLPGGEVDLLALTVEQRRQYRGTGIAMIFQEPMSSLNPVMTVGEQLAEAVSVHRRRRGPANRASEGAARSTLIQSRNEGREDTGWKPVPRGGVGPESVSHVGSALASFDPLAGDPWAVVEQSLRLVGIDGPARRARQYPHELSGGMRQRVMIAMALCLSPRLVIADEPTTALDATVQGQVLDLLEAITRDRGGSLVLITHDLSLVSGRADVVCVMYAGRIVECAPAQALFERPSHPYTRALLACVPALARPGERLATVRESMARESAFAPVGEGRRPWWPWHDPPSPNEAEASFVEVAPDHVVLAWSSSRGTGAAGLATGLRLARGVEGVASPA